MPRGLRGRLTTVLVCLVALWMHFIDRECEARLLVNEPGAGFGSHRFELLQAGVL